MKKVFCGRTLVASLTIMLLAISSFTANAQRTNFSGDWKLNEAKSDLGEFGAWAARTMKAEQHDDAIATTRVSPGFNGGDPITTAGTVKFDGSVAESEGFGGSNRKSTAKWSDDGKTLTINTSMVFERDGQSFEVKSTENWTMTADGQLSVVTNSSSPRGESTVKAIYDK